MSTYAIGAAAAVVAAVALSMPAAAQQYSYNASIEAGRVNWSGMYTGFHSGGVQGKTFFVRKSYTPTNPSLCASSPSLCAALDAYRATDIPTGTSHSVDIDGFHVGPHIGYQQQLGNWLIGADVGFSFGGGDGERDCTGPAGGAAALAAEVVSSVATSFGARCKSEYRYSANVRGRIGYATGNWLFYGMAGLTKARVDNSVVFTESNAFGTFVASERGSAYPNGYVFGLGLEYQAANGLRWGLSYTHILLEDTTVVLKDAFGGSSGSRYTNDPDVLGASLKVPLQQQPTQVADAGPPAQQQTAQAQPAAQRAAAQQRPATQPPAQRPAAQPAAAPPARPRTAPAAAPPATTAPPAARRPVQGQPQEPDEEPVQGRPRK